MTKFITRRDLIRTAALAAGAFTIVPRHVLGGPRNIAPSEKMNIAGIGIGGMGGANVNALAGENIVALCDVDFARGAGLFAKYPKAKTYIDYREMLDKQKDIDGVVVGTPDHTHAVISMAAMKAGKHVYCQKPLCHDVYEARMLARAAKEAKVATQMGIQGHSGEGIRLVCEWVWAGLIGEVREVDAWCSLSYYPWGHAGWSSRWSQRPKDTPPVPAHAGLGPVDRSGGHAAIPSGLSSGRVAMLVGFRLRDDGRSRRPYARPGLFGFEAVSAHQHRGHIVRQHQGRSPALGDCDVPVPSSGRDAAASADLVRGHASATARRVGRRPKDAGRGGSPHQRQQGDDHVWRLRREPADHSRDEDEGR